jgi:hypothetical protein
MGRARPKGMSPMDPEIASLIYRLEGKDDPDSKLAAVILESVFDPENQLSPFGTMLIAQPQDE